MKYDITITEFYWQLKWICACDMQVLIGSHSSAKRRIPDAVHISHMNVVRYTWKLTQD